MWGHVSPSSNSDLTVTPLRVWGRSLNLNIGFPTCRGTLTLLTSQAVARVEESCVFSPRYGAGSRIRAHTWAHTPSSLSLSPFTGQRHRCAGDPVVLPRLPYSVRFADERSQRLVFCFWITCEPARSFHCWPPVDILFKPPVDNTNPRGAPWTVCAVMLGEDGKGEERATEKRGAFRPSPNKMWSFTFKAVTASGVWMTYLHMGW